MRFKALVAVHLFLIRNEHILLLRRHNTGYADGQYSVIAGHLDGNEEVKMAMIREAWEEAGIEIEPPQLQVVGVMHRKSGGERIDFFLVATEWTNEISNKEPHKCDELAWYPLDALSEKTIPYIRTAITNYQQGKWFDSFGWE